MRREGTLRDQEGVISRVQALADGFTANDLRRLLRRREWVTVFPGVYIDHTGELTWVQRAWAAVLFASPASLSHESALRAAEGPGKYEEEIIHVAVGRDRRISPPDGVRIHRITHLQERTQWNLGPPRMRYEEAALDVAIGSPTDRGALDVLASAVQSRRTTAKRILARLGARRRRSRRAWLVGVLEDVDAGACSVLEHGYLNRVERAHGFPPADRQRRATSTLGVVYRDAAYDTLLLELDGRLFHDNVGQRDRDLDRDLDAVVDGDTPIRLGYGQVFDRPCQTALRVETLLRQRGWTGSATPCGQAAPSEAPGCHPLTAPLLRTRRPHPVSPAPSAQPHQPSPATSSATSSAQPQLTVTPAPPWP